MAFSRKFTCFGKTIHGIRVCSCFFDLTIYALDKVETVNDFWNLYEKHGVNLGENLFWNCYNDCYLVCCRKHIDWLTATNYKNVFGKSSTECIECPNTPYELRCLNFAKDLCDFCISCTGNLCDVLENSLYMSKLTETGVAVMFKPKKIARMCECFHQDWIKISCEKTELVRRLFDKYKTLLDEKMTSLSVDPEAELEVTGLISEIKEIISSWTEFGTNVEHSFFLNNRKWYWNSSHLCKLL